ncbi:MAG: OPT/YSL family transporter [Deltaproteobacteria bacterium]|nr:OPT/YSL family transporter [Deltaproteobacteria bacterium]
MKQNLYREITPAGLVLGVFQGIVMTMAFTYAGLKLGFTMAGSTIAAILGFVFLKGILKKGTIVENNINQTVASAINISSAGIIFTFPALLLMGRPFPLLPIILASVAGSFLGIMVIIPMRRQMIELDRLRFPTGTAVSTILMAPGAGIQKAKLMLAGIFLSSVTVILIKAGLLPGELKVGVWFHLPSYTNTVIALSLMNFGAGLLAGRPGLPLAVGGILGWWVLSPVAHRMGWVAQLSSGSFYTALLRPLGIGVLIGGALMGVVISLPAIKAALGSLSKMKEKSSLASAEELSSGVLLWSMVLSLAVLFLATYITAPQQGVLLSGAIAVVGTVWIALAGIIVAQCTGMTDMSPISGLALIAVTLILAMTHKHTVLAILVGTTVCVAISQCADMMQDLKTGFLVGAHPRRQQISQIAFAWIGPVVSIGTVLLLWHTSSGAPGFGPQSAACLHNAPGCLPAPQATALKAMVESVIHGQAPVGRYLAGGLLGGVLSLVPGGSLGVLVGLAMYLPFSITLGYGLGCLANMAVVSKKGKGWFEDKGVPFAAGLIVGEALTELTFSFLIIVRSLN